MLEVEFVDGAVRGDEVNLQVSQLSGIEVSILAHMWQDLSPCLGVNFSRRNALVAFVAVGHVNAPAVLQLQLGSAHIHGHFWSDLWDCIEIRATTHDK